MKIQTLLSAGPETFMYVFEEWAENISVPRTRNVHHIYFCPTYLPRKLGCVVAENCISGAFSHHQNWCII
jgi:hypothetical protein